MSGTITVGIPAYNVPDEVLNRLLHTIQAQTPASVILYGDGDGKQYSQVQDMGGVVLKGKTNEGPGVARQRILEACKTDYITFCDADDLLATPLFLEHAIKLLDDNRQVAVAAYTFLQLNENGDYIPHEHNDVWVFGRVYRVSFLRKYDIHFPEFRANEDTCFQKQCNLLTDNDNERTVYVKDVAYYWCYNPNSITRIGNSQYGDDQCQAGWILSTIHAINHVRKYRPFSEKISLDIVNSMIQSYFYYVKCLHDHPFFARQQWYYIKKLYHELYKDVGKYITPDALSEIYSVLNMQNAQQMIHIIPQIGITEFFDRLEQEPYDPDEIFTIWADMYKEQPELLQNNVKCGVMPKNYWTNLSKKSIDKKKKA